MKWWDPHTNKFKCFSSATFYEHNNKLGKGCSPGSELIFGTNTSTLPKIKIYLSDHPFIKDDIFEVNVNFLQRGTPIGIVTQYCEHQNMSYISQSANNSLWYHAFPDRNSTNVWILGIFSQEPKTFQQVLESISSHKLTVKSNRVKVITACRYKGIIRTNLQENRCIFNQIRHV